MHRKDFLKLRHGRYDNPSSPASLLSSIQKNLLLRPDLQAKSHRAVTASKQIEVTQPKEIVNTPALST